MPSLVKNSRILEFEFHTKPGVERTQVARIGVSVHSRRTIADWFEEVGVRNADGALCVLVHAQQRFVVGDVEQVSSKPQPAPFCNPDGIVDVVVDLAKVLGATQRATSRGAVGGVVGAEWEFAASSDTPGAQTSC